jgi:hypothetical protein
MIGSSNDSAARRPVRRARQARVGLEHLERLLAGRAAVRRRGTARPSATRCPASRSSRRRRSCAAPAAGTWGGREAPSASARWPPARGWSSAPAITRVADHLLQQFQQAQQVDAGGEETEKSCAKRDRASLRQERADHRQPQQQPVDQVGATARATSAAGTPADQPPARRRSPAGPTPCPQKFPEGQHPTSRPAAPCPSSRTGHRSAASRTAPSAGTAPARPPAGWPGR